MSGPVVIPHHVGMPIDAPSPSWFMVYDKVNVKCPCGRYAALDHDVAHDGTVTPSLVCPFDPPEHYHVFAQLESWSRLSEYST